MIGDDAKHFFAVFVVTRERAEFFRHLRGGRVGNARHDRGDRAAERAPFIAIIGMTGRHQQSADIGVAEAKRPEFIGELGDFFRRELRHQNGNFQDHRPKPHRMFESVDVNGAVCALERHQVQRREVAGRIVEEHVFRAWIGRVDTAAHTAGVPLVDRGVELQAGIRAGPGCVTDLVPKLAGRRFLRDRTVGPHGQRPRTVASTAFTKSFVIRTELFEFCPETVR